MKQRPWIWLIIANLMFITGILVMVTVAVRHREKEVPVARGH